MPSSRRTASTRLRWTVSLVGAASPTGIPTGRRWPIAGGRRSNAWSSKRLLRRSSARSWRTSCGPDSGVSASLRSSVALPQAVRARKARRFRIDLLPYLLIAPAVLLVALVTLYPALDAIGISTTNANLLHLATTKSVGLDNYTKAWDDEIFTGALWHTLRWVIVNAGGQMLVALPVALFLNTAFRGRGLVRAAILIPWVVPGAVVAIIWRYMVDANYGVVNDLLLRLGVISESIAWIGEPLPSFAVISTATIWAGFPFFAVTLLAALQV